MNFRASLAKRMQCKCLLQLTSATYNESSGIVTYMLNSRVVEYGTLLSLLLSIWVVSVGLYTSRIDAGRNGCSQLFAQDGTIQDKYASLIAELPLRRSAKRSVSTGFAEKKRH